MPNGAFTEHLFADQPVKEIIRIEGPHGAFYLREQSDKPMIFVAGGTGFAPIKSVIEHALHSGVQRPMVLYWGQRTKRDLYLPDLPLAWAANHPNFKYVPVLSEPLPSDEWTGRTGFVLLKSSVIAAALCVLCIHKNFHLARLGLWTAAGAYSALCAYHLFLFTV